MITTIGLISNIVYFLLLYYVCTQLLLSHPKSYKVLVFMAFAVASLFFPYEPYLNLLLFTIVVVLYNFNYLKTQCFLMLMLVVCYFMVILIVDIYSLILIKACTALPFETISNVVIYFLLCKSIGLVFVITSAYVMKEIALQYRTRLNRLLISMLTIFSFTIVPIIIIVLPIVRDEMNYNIPVAVFLLAYPAILVYLLHTFIEYSKKEHVQSIENANHQVNQLYYQQLDDRIIQTKALHHDTLKHYRTLQSFMHEKDVEKASAYLKKLQVDIEHVKFSYTGNSILDVILEPYQRIFKDHSLEAEYFVGEIDLTFIDPVDLTIIIANIMDNAMDSCDQSAQKKVKFVAQRKKEHLVLKISNSCDGVDMDHDTFLSTKHEGKSYGLANIKKSASKYNGQCIFQYHQDSHLFTSAIIFPNERLKKV